MNSLMTRTCPLLTVPRRHDPYIPPEIDRDRLVRLERQHNNGAQLARNDIQALFAEINRCHSLLNPANLEWLTL